MSVRDAFILAVSSRSGSVRSSAIRSIAWEKSWYSILDFTITADMGLWCTSEPAFGYMKKLPVSIFISVLTCLKSWCFVPHICMHLTKSGSILFSSRESPLVSKAMLRYTIPLVNRLYS